jgi:hypothetical protein
MGKRTDGKVMVKSTVKVRKYRKKVTVKFQNNSKRYHNNIISGVLGASPLTRGTCITKCVSGQIPERDLVIEGREKAGGKQIRRGGQDERN